MVHEASFTFVMSKPSKSQVNSNESYGLSKKTWVFFHPSVSSFCFCNTSTSNFKVEQQVNGIILGWFRLYNGLSVFT